MANKNLVSDSHSSDSSNFFLGKAVERSCHEHSIKGIFQTLLLQKKAKQQDLADFCSVDKSYISKIINGLYYPKLRMRLKIAEFFEVDSCLIWRADGK